MNICIRADGGSEIGMGHIMRTLVLAEELRKKHKVFYACRIDKPFTDKYKAGIELIKKKNFNIVYINENNINTDICNINADCIITDSYDVDEEYFNIVKKHFKISGCLDDEKICDYFNVDFLINQNPYADKLNYNCNCNTSLMLGTKFVILRDEFRNCQFKKNINKTVKDIMITVGGSDNNNLTKYIIEQLNKLDYRLHIVIGSGFKYGELLKKYESENILLYFNATMSELMKKCDICISSCGSTLYELAMLNIPTIGIVVAENQQMAAESMDELGIIKYSSLQNLALTVEQLDYNKRLELSENAKKLVDGKGVHRIVEKIESGINI